MNPEFLVMNDTKKKSFMDTVLEAKALLTAITGDTAMMVAQNLGYCEESPQMAALAKKDALAAVAELTGQAARLQKIIVEMQA